MLLYDVLFCFVRAILTKITTEKADSEVPREAQWKQKNNKTKGLLFGIRTLTTLDTEGRLRNQPPDLFLKHDLARQPTAMTAGVKEQVPPTCDGSHHSHGQ
jgi:hypothetical protein